MIIQFWQSDATTFLVGLGLLLLACALILIVGRLRKRPQFPGVTSRQLREVLDKPGTEDYEVVVEVPEHDLSCTIGSIHFIPWRRRVVLSFGRRYEP